MIIGHVGVGPSWSSIGGRRRKRVFRIVNKKKQEDHYVVLGVPPSASPAHIKKAFRLLARKWHPDVNKDLRAAEMFKTIHLAYQVLSDETARIEYDRLLKFHESTSEPIRRNNIYRSSGFEDEIEVNGWSERQKAGENRRTKRYCDTEGSFSYYAQSKEQPTNNESKEERSSLLEVLQSVFLSVFLMHTIGCQPSLVYSTLTAWLDSKLDAGYKFGYLISFVLGGRGGVLLSICLRFASWVCGKNSSSVFALVIVATWVGSNILTYAPLPQSVLLALLYMSVKLQGDLKF